MFDCSSRQRFRGQFAPGAAFFDSPQDGTGVPLCRIFEQYTTDFLLSSARVIILKQRFRFRDHRFVALFCRQVVQALTGADTRGLHLQRLPIHRFGVARAIARARGICLRK